MKRSWIVALLMGAPALTGCVSGPEVVIDSAATERSLYLLAVRQDGNVQARKVVRCDRAADGSLANCSEVALVMQGE
ncbi:MAG TPA: hypothetical protein PLU22_26700 [Polyangiaceae bacterium]|nr:hypothetical protein [Polyangiaceae bacterium]